MSRRRTILLVSCAVLAGGCSDDGTGGSDTVVTASLTNFPADSPAQGHYELWVSFATPRAGGIGPRHSEAASAGKFRVDTSGSPVDLNGDPIVFEITPGTPNAPVDEATGKIVWVLAADSFVTVEPAGDDDGEPHLPGLVAGAFEEGTSRLAVDASDAIDVDLSSVAGSFVLATPTTGTTVDENEGVWFTVPGGTAGALTLPILPPGEWRYAGWYRSASGQVDSLGSFRDPGAPDADGAGPRGGTGYPYPGSDFPTGFVGADLSTGTVSVTLEPPGDVDGTEPFLEILAAPVGGAAPGTSVAMTASSLPAGTVEIPR